MKSILALIALVLFGAAASAQTEHYDRPGEYLTEAKLKLAESGQLSFPEAINKTHVCGDFYPSDGPAVRPKAGPVLRYHIATDGTVRDIEIERSSGYPALDKAAVACVSKWTYSPARTPARANGTPIEIEWENNVGWDEPKPVVPGPVNTITTQARVKSVPRLAAPFSIGKPHTCNDVYPIEARQAGQEGMVTIVFTISEKGDVTNPSVQTSSGSAALDQASLECARAWRYGPARNDNGDPIAVPWAAKIKWSLNGAGPQPQPIGKPHLCIDDFYPSKSKAAHEEGDTKISFIVTADGRVAHVKVIETSNHKRLDDAAVRCVSTWRFAPAIVDGKPTDMELKDTVVWWIRKSGALDTSSPTAH